MMQPCGYCSKCKEGHVAECYFPLPESKTKSVSTMSANALASYYSNVGKTNTVVDSKSYSACAHSHKPLIIQPANANVNTAPIIVYGGKGGDPVKKDCDIYAKLDRYTSSPFANYPWSENKRVMFSFHIPDHSTPEDPAEFKRMIAWLAEQARAGKSIHVGCVGGHGRTGMVLAALVKEIAGVEDAITYVRENYCKKAVESSSQVKFLAKHFGITEVKGSKDYSTKPTKADLIGDPVDAIYYGRKSGSRAERHNAKYARASNDIAYPIKPVKLAGNIWGIGREQSDKADDENSWDAL